MNEAIAVVEPRIEAYEKAIVLGDLSGLKPEERLSYYKAVCKSVGLNPLTRPFEYTLLNGKLILYAKRDATDQLRNIHSVSVVSLEQKIESDIVTVTCRVQNAAGRTDVSTGVLPITGLKGVELANALMKCETKAKRRATLSICGLGLLDETELETATMAESATVKQSRREVERATLEVSTEPNRGHGQEHIADDSPTITVSQGAAPGIANPFEARPPHWKAPEAEKRPTENLVTQVLAIRPMLKKLTPKQVLENKQLKKDGKPEHEPQSYFVLECINDVSLYVWDQKLFKAIMPSVNKKAEFVVSRGPKGHISVDDVLDVGGVKFTRDKDTKECIPTEIVEITTKPATGPPTQQTAFQHGANRRSISAEISKYEDKDSMGDTFKSGKTGKPFVIVKVKDLDADTKHDPHGTFYCHNPALFPSLKVSVGRKITFEYSVTVGKDGVIWQTVESIAAEDITQDTGFFS